MPQSEIVIRGAREHNLRDVNLTLPKNKLIVMTGVSGSGKSSLAFDTLYAEGQRRYVESLSSYARQFLGQMPKPDVDSITGLSPSISIEQKTAGRNPRSTVGTITEIYDYLRVLFARVGQGYCYVSGKPIRAQSADQIVESIAALGREADDRISILAPLFQNQKGEYRDLFEDLLKQGFLRARVDGEIIELNNPPKLKRHFKHTIEVVIDRLVLGKTGRTRLAEAVETALRYGKGTLIVVSEASGGRQPPESSQDDARSSRGADAARSPSNEKLFSANYSCPESGMSYEPPTPQLFSFNSPLGMCPECTGLGWRHDFVVERLVAEPKKTIAQGALHLMKPLRQTGRWQRHLYEGAAAAIEEDLALKPGSVLKTAWLKLHEDARQRFLYGTRDRHVTYSWRHRGGVWKHGGTWGGILGKLLEDYRETKNPMRRRQLEKYMDFAVCTACGGGRLNKQASHVRLTTASSTFKKRHKRTELSLPEVCALSIADAADFFSALVLDSTQALIATEAVKEISGRLGFLLRCGLDYLTLERTAPTLSGGESQRIRLAGQIGCGLVGVVYILDEPSIGLHPRDNTKLLESLQDLRDQGNTVIVVEHDEETMRAADLVVDFGPGPGVRGGEIIAHGSVEDVKADPRSVTGQYLTGQRRIEIPALRRSATDAKLTIRGARHHNLKDVEVDVPLGMFVCVTGVSGSGKSSLVNDILWPVLNRDINEGLGNPGPHEEIVGLNRLDKAIDIDQSPIGRTPRSNPATYVKVFDHIRDLYTNLPQAKLRGYPPGRFSFNVEGGRCEACEGHGATKLEMDFLADIWVPCPVCEGHRFNRETLEVKFKDKSIAEVLEMDVQQALEHFENVPKVRRLLQALHDVGLDYLKLGQPSPTLSGGEAQRVKLARELGKRSTGRTIYLLDEPTTGLHFADVHRLLDVLHGFVAAGNTVLVVEHNLDVIKTADWVIDLGPEGGEGGGRIVAQGTPEDVAACEESYTGAALRAVLPDWAKGSGGRQPSEKLKRSRRSKTREADTSRSPVERWQLSSVARRTNGNDTKEITIRGASQHNLQNIDIDVPRDRMSVFCGPSGSGKSSLAMDTLYAEGQRRYVESLSAYARQFLGQMPKPRVEHVHGLSPAIAIEQKTVGHTPRSTVGTVTEIYDYLRLLFARLGTPHCPACDIPVGKSTTDQIVEKVLGLAATEGSRETASVKALLLAPQKIHKGESYKKLFDRLKSQGFGRVRIDGTTYEFADVPTLDHREDHAIEVVVDRITLDRKQRGRIADSIEAALDLGRGELRVALADSNKSEDRWEVKRFSLHASCESCGRSFDTLGPQNFSFNSPLGWCAACEGLGVERGTEQSALIANPHVSLRDGAIAAWPDPKQDALFGAMLDAMGAELGLPLDVPFDRLEAAQQRIVMYGADRWITVGEPGASAPGVPQRKGLSAPHGTAQIFRFQYKGLYPALNEAARVSYSYRVKLRDHVGDQDCSACEGHRIRDDAAAVRLRSYTLPRLCRLPLGESFKFLDGLKLSKEEKRIAGDLLNEAKSRLKFLVEVGLEYLTLDRTMPTLSGGESQRIRLAGQIGRALTGVLYVLDEPTIGLHARDNNRLLGALKRLRDLGNTVVLVEHDREVIEASDRVFDFGPGSGRLGGLVTAQGTPKQIAKDKNSLTGRYLSDAQSIPIPMTRRVASAQQAAVTSQKPGSDPRQKKLSNPESSQLSTLNSHLILSGCRHHNLRNVDLRIPLGTFVCVTGVSGSGKSSLIEGTLAKAVARKLNQSGDMPGPFAELKGVEYLSKIIAVDQQPLGSTPASNPATYTGVFDLIRELFCRMPEAKVRGYKPARFSFNRPGGRCEDCEGLGQKKIEMHFLPDVWVECETCKGRRYNTETLSVTYKGKSIADVLEMSIAQAYELFQDIPKVRGPLAVLCAIGLEYLTLGQSAPTLSGGEAQRVKLAAELARPQSGRTLYLLDEPTTGLHFDDIAKLLKVLNSLVDQGNTVVVIEHNLDVIKSADWIIDLGPEAGAEGGWIVAQGTPEDVAALAPISSQISEPAGSSRRNNEPVGARRKQARAQAPRLAHRSYTAEMLAPVLAKGTRAERESFDVAAETKAKKGDKDLTKVGRGTKMPWQADGRQWHCVDRISHDGKPCQWEGEALEFVLEEIAALGGFADPNFNHRSVVEILPAMKTGGWFLHVHTAQQWWVKFTFRVKKNSFTTAELASQFDLPTADNLDLPVYGNEPRVIAQNLRLPWQEVNFKIHWKREIDVPAFRSFLAAAKNAFFAQSEKAKLNPADLTPWKVLGKKWHLAKKGFSSPPVWDLSVLERLVERLNEAAPEANWDWENKQVVSVRINGNEATFAEIYTKRPGGADLVLPTEPGRVPLGRIASLGYEREVASHRRGEAVRMRFTEAAQVDEPTLKELLAELTGTAAT